VSGKSLRALLDSILDSRRIDESASNFTPQRVDVRTTLMSALQLIDPMEGNLAHRDLHLAVPEDLAIWGDAVRLQQILTNLVSNALKYSPADTPIEITARVIAEGKQHAQQVEITVRDHGLGVPPEQAPLLFNRFVRLPRDIASTIVGNGVGLYLCRVLTEAMHGTIELKSTGIAGEGSTFVIHLPQVRPQRSIEHDRVLTVVSV
jgi:two-component system, NarL family, capsular synthesis sensor histidine kinase RcsC